MTYISINKGKHNNYGLVRKTDLDLRAAFPELQTTIYQTNDGSFVIHIKNKKVDFIAIQEEFEKSIKPIILPLALSLKEPKGNPRIIAHLEDKDIPKGLQGVLMPKFRWADMLISKFPKINIYKISDEQGILNIHIANYWSQEKSVNRYHFITKVQKEAFLNFLKQYQSGLEFRVHIEELENAPIPKNGHSEDDSSAYYCNHIVRNKLKYVQRDESIWYDNINAIFEGSYKKNQLYFIDENEYTCYVDFSVYPNLDLRYFLLLYQRIYITPPISQNFNEWIQSFKITKTDFFELVLRERITLLLVQDVSRYDSHFLNEIYSLKPDAIVSRRAIACLQQCDIIETSNNYIFGDGISVKELKFISELISKNSKLDPKIVFKSLTWPISAKRQSFNVLQMGGILSASVYGVNKIIDNPPKTNVSESSSFMLNVFSYAAHLSNALNATYFPVRGEDGFTDAVYTEQMGTLLNFYKGATVNSLKNVVLGQQQLIKGNTFIEPIDLLQLNEYIPILEFESVLSKEIVFPNSKRLMETLAGLSPEQQREKIKLYNAEIERFLNIQKKTNFTLDLSAQTLNVALGVASGVPTGPLMFMLKLMTKKPLRRFNPVRGLMEKIDLAMHQSEDDVQNIHFLSRINRVAKLKDF